MNHSQANFHKFLFLWSGQLISAIGSGLSSFGLSVYVFRMTGKASATALVTLLAFLPSLLLSAPAGVLADRYDRRLLMMLGDGLSAVGLLFMLVCKLSGELTLWQICAGVSVSSVFASLLEPAYKATVTDLLTTEQYAKASGLIGTAGSAKYLISPMLAGLLLTVSDISLLLFLDICTFFLTVAAAFTVRKSIGKKEFCRHQSLIHEFCSGFRIITANRGVFTLVMVSSAVTFFLGFVQTLFTPMLLAFTNSSVLGIAETVCALGMLVSSLFIGINSIKTGYVKILSASLFCAGIAMAGSGFRENIILICAFGFLFFTMLPFANMSLDVLIRMNISNDFQGRVWGLTGILSQAGYVAAYAVSGVLADAAGRRFGIGAGRGAGCLITGAGLLLSVTAIILSRIKSIQKLETLREDQPAAR